MKGVPIRSIADAYTTAVSRAERVDGCLVQQGAINSNGYPCVAVGGGRTMLWHRLAWTHLRGPVPDGYHVHHKCHNRRCANVDHLECVSPAEHGEAHRPTKCKAGHPLHGGNVHRHKKGTRECRACRNTYRFRKTLTPAEVAARSDELAAIYLAEPDEG